MVQIDRYVLGLAVLEGDRDARKILADLLEDQGDRGLADWARRCKGKARWRLQLVIMILPFRAAVRLGSEFAEAACYGTSAKQILKAIAEWYTGNTSESQTLFLCREALAKSRSARITQLFVATNLAMEERMNTTLQKAIDSLEAAIEASKTAVSNPRGAHYLEQQANHKAREVARLSQFLILPDVDNEGSRNSGLEWQIGRTKAVLDHLVSPDKFSWPT